MENSEKLLDLLQKDKLTGEEQQQFKLLTQNDPGLVRLCDSYKKISNAVRYNSHLSTEEISEYILFKNGLPNDGNGITILAPKLEEHLRICKICEDEFKELNNEFAESQIFFNTALTKYTNSDLSKLSLPGVFRRPYNLKITFVTTIAILLFCLSAVIISNITKPHYYDLAQLSNKSEFSITRGRATDDFQRGIEAYDERNYTQAITFFNNDIKFNGSESTIFYTYYILGLTSLESAQRNILGLFPSFDKEKVSNSITNLKICIQKNNTGVFPDINMNAYYYMAKANLMLGNKEEAAICLKNVITGKGSKMNEAAKILNELE